MHLHWVVQSNLINPATRDHLVQLLEQRQTPFTLVKLALLFHQLDGEVVDPAGPVFDYGSAGLGHVAKARGWRRGRFDKGLDYELMLARYGERTLNAGSVCAPLGVPRSSASSWWPAG